MNHCEHPGYWAVLPAAVRYDSTLKPNAKLLYSEITALCDQRGYCWATNDYFAGLFGLSVGTISRLISQLEKRGYIRTEMASVATGSERRIYAGVFTVSKGGLAENDNTPPESAENAGGLAENSKGGLAENSNPQYENNINIINPPIIPPEGGAPPDAAKKARRRRSGCKSQPDWKPDRFAKFWDYYPRGESKQAAIRAWDNLRPSDELIDTMAAALRRQKKSESWRSGIGIPYASRWINERRWEDELRTDCSAEAAPPPSRGEGVRYL